MLLLVYYLVFIWSNHFCGFPTASPVASVSGQYDKIMTRDKIFV